MLSSTVACGGLDGMLSSTVACGGLEGMLSITVACGGLDGMLSIMAKAELATAQPATKATRLTFIMNTPCVINRRDSADHLFIVVCPSKGAVATGIPSRFRIKYA